VRCALRVGCELWRSGEPRFKDSACAVWGKQLKELLDRGLTRNKRRREVECGSQPYLISRPPQSMIALTLQALLQLGTSRTCYSGRSGGKVVERTC